mmetsp:Transcript_41647/g.63632  ORF Transcript_41647/g.63632 Transcript_41647/m.63632 type:complete len:153 (-) Transcript_41647:6631-7089(-)
MTSTSLVYKLTDLPVSNLTKQVKLLFEVGQPDGMEIFTTTLLEVSPKLIQVTPNTGSSLTSKIHINAPGVTEQTLDTFSIKSSTDTDVCHSMVIEEYPTITCFTNEGELTSGDIVLRKGDTDVTCEGAHATNCLYEQTTAFPAIASYVVTSS